MGGVALFCTGRCSNYRIVVVADGCNYLGFKVVAVCAIAPLLTILRTGCVFYSVPCTVAVALGIDIAVDVRISAVGAGMGGIALFRTGGSGYYRSVVMADGGDDFRFEVVAVVAITPLLTVFRTGGFLHYIPRTVAVTLCIDIAVDIGIATVGTSMRSVTLFCTSRCSNYRIVVVTV